MAVGSFGFFIEVCWKIFLENGTCARRDEVLQVELFEALFVFFAQSSIIVDFPKMYSGAKEN